MADWEFDNVKCSAFDGQETEFYHWAIKLKKDPWIVRTDEFRDIKYLFFRWNQGRGNGFEVSMKVDLETGHYDVCNVVPLAIPQFTPREYNENLERFVNEILTPFNRDNGNILHVVHEKCGGHLTYDSGFSDLDKCWTEKHTMDMMEHLKCELFHARLELMEDVLNRHIHEIISRESHAVVSHQIEEIINQQLLRPGDCDLMMAAQCFVGMCMKKMLMCTPPTNMFDDFLTDEYRAHLSKLIGVDSWRLEDDIQIGAVRTNFYSLYDEGVRNGTQH